MYGGSTASTKKENANGWYGANNPICHRLRGQALLNPRLSLLVAGNPVALCDLELDTTFRRQCYVRTRFMPIQSRAGKTPPLMRHRWEWRRRWPLGLLFRFTEWMARPLSRICYIGKPLLRPGDSTQCATEMSSVHEKHLIDCNPSGYTIGALWVPLRSQRHPNRAMSESRSMMLFCRNGQAQLTAQASPALVRASFNGAAL
jgi:hypothetical protein